jgi:uncharacterized membrane protein (UPF0127 family)
MYIGLGVIAVAVILIFMKDLFPDKKYSLKVDQQNQSPNDIESRFRDDGRLTFSKEDGKPITHIAIEIADDERARTQGLMGRKILQRDHGMLFVFQDEEERSFWMVNTPLPLDIIYVNSEKKIVKIQANTTPFSDASLPSEKPAQYTIEVNAGFCNQYGIQEGDVVDWVRK